MASSWRLSKRGYRYRPKISTDPEDYYKLDSKKSPQENCYDIYSSLCLRGTNDNKRLYLLNGLATLLQHSKDVNLGFSSEELLYCLSVSLAHSFTQVRAAALRSIRYLLITPKDIHLLNSLQLPQLVCRSIDVLLKNDDERVQALKLIRKMLAISPENISPVVVRCLVSLADSGIEDGDRMLRTCLATLCEFGVLNPTLLIVCGGVGSITRNVLECHSPRIAESLCGVLLHLLEWPHTRYIAGVRLDCLAAPYCDFTYRLGIMDKNKDARELRYTSSRLALLSVLRSWGGTLEFCDPNKPSGLKAIVDVLYLNQLESRKAILDLLYELLGLPQPIWTDEYSVALAAVDPSDVQDAWLLTNGFIAMEGRCILPSLANRVPNKCEQHLALLLFCFLETGLLNALIEVIVTSDTFISVRATILVGKLLHLIHTHLPADICNTSPALPTLISHAANGNHQATAAISALQNYHQMLRNRPAPFSLFLDNIIQSGALLNSRLFKRDINSQENNNAMLLLSNGFTLERRRLDSVSSSVSDDTSSLPSSSSKRSSFRIKGKRLTHFFENLKKFDRLIKESNVLAQADGNAWDWDIVVIILKADTSGKLDEPKGKFFKRLVHYFKPSSNRFSHQDLAHGRTVPSYVTAGLELIDCLLKSNELESMRMLTDLFSDISQQLLAIMTSHRAHDCLFSPQHMSSTMCQKYFLFIGRMCRSPKGVRILMNTDVFGRLSMLVTTTDHVCYVKLIVSGLDYSNESCARKILEKALTSSKTLGGRQYATQFMLVLLRAQIPNFEVWGIPMLITQTRDSKKSVVLAAVEVLDEASHEKNYLEELVSIWPNLKPLGDIGRLIMCRYYSIPRGLNHQRAKIKDEIEFWNNCYNKRYVLLVDADVHSSLTLHIKNEDGFYSRRNCSTRPIIIPPNIQPHLYGQLVQTEQGMSALKKYGDLNNLIETVTKGKCSDDNECQDLKAALWAIGHASTHSNGIEFFNDSIFRIYEKIIYLTTNAEVYSIRATAFSVLGVISSTNAGANLLYKMDWLSVRHDRNTLWPVYQPEDWNSNNLTPVRHHYVHVPPYNYTGIYDNINDFNTSSDSNSFFLDEKVDSKGNIKDEIDGQMTATAKMKCRTLPENNTGHLVKHTRSLSESKTTDVISLIAGGHQTHRTRFNSGTDSNTSGVSSCESVFGRLLTGDLQQTQLSPIPSTSNLLELPSSNSRIRRISITGSTFRETPISPQDMQGYAKLRELTRRNRPVLSESAADELADIIERPRKLSISDSQRKIKVRSLDRQSSMQMIMRLNSEEFQVPLPTLAPAKFISQNDSKGPIYSGICLPKDLMLLFPTRNLTRTYVSRDIHDQDLMEINLLTSKQQFLNDSINEGDESSLVSSLSDVSSASKRTKWAGKHNPGNCLNCCRSRVHRLNPPMDSEISIFKRKSNQSSSIQLSDISFNSPESILSEESMPDRLTANILHHVQRMANPVCSKQSKIALLEIKQKHPTSFQDICLYSEVCKTLGRSTYRMSSRRFLQELFLDLNFDSFYVEPNEIISKKDKDTTSSICSAIDDDQRDQDIASISNANETQMNNHFDMVLQTRLGYLPIAHKSHLKSPPLESVCETSYENLSDSFTSKVNKNLLSPELNALTSKLDTIDSRDDTTSPSNLEMHSSSLPISPYEQLNQLNSVLARHGISNVNRHSIGHQAIILSEPAKSAFTSDCIEDSSSNISISTSTSNYSDSNRNSIISKSTIENENQHHSRGRFYTLELDLSCTKNKFPITDHRKKDYLSPTTPTLTILESVAVSSVETLSKPSSNTLMQTNCNKVNLLTASTSTYHSNVNTSINPKTITSTYYPQITFTKSLSASIAKPIGSLYCEKRLHSSKSEAVLSRAKRN